MSKIDTINKDANTQREALWAAASHLERVAMSASLMVIALRNIKEICEDTQPLALDKLERVLRATESTLDMVNRQL